MCQSTDHSLPVPESDALAALLARHLGPGPAAVMLGATPRRRHWQAICTHLLAARDTIATYLPRRLLARELATDSAPPWIEWVEGALLFADVSGSTALAERLGALGHEGAEIVTETLNAYFATMIRIIAGAGGDVLGFGGDALLALFEGPQATAVAASAALDLLRELAGFEREVPGVGRFPLTMHIGVESGAIALVGAGQAHSRRYSAMGATVSTVARAEACAGPGEVVLGPRAWAALATVAEGELLEGGFARVRALRVAPPLVALPALPHVDETASPSSEMIAHLAAQVERCGAYLPIELVTRIIADPRRPRVEADLRPVTVLFAQLAGLEGLIEGRPAEESAAAVNAIVNPLQVAVERFGGFVNKLDLAEEGIRLMAVFGAPLALEDHAERAARAALLMQAAVQAAEQPLRFRAGLNTGNVFAGNVGSAERKEYTVMGDAVNVAARVMAGAEWGEVRCASATAARITHALVCADRRKIAAKGKREPLEVLRVLGEREHPLEPVYADAPLIGRDRELAWLRELWVAAAGSGRVARVSGEAGIGKSRLVAALAAEVRAAGARVFTVRCLAYNSATPYAPWSELLRSMCAIAASDDPSTRIRKLAAALEAAGFASTDWLSLVADLARVQVEESSVVRGLDPQQRRTRRFTIMLALLRAAARQSRPEALPGAPVVVIFDNLHWADQVSLELWRHIATHLSDAPILLLGLHRGPLAWEGDPAADGAAMLELRPLTARASAALLDALAPSRPIAPHLRDRLVDRAAGNPLFLEELLRAVSERPDAADALPDSLSGLLLSRIDRLDETSRAILRVAAVVGQRFPASVVESVHPLEHEVLIRQLLLLDHAEITTTEREHPERIHLFRHALLHEVAYQSLLYARRRELHRRIGEHLETRYAAELARVRAYYRDDRSAYLVPIGRNGSLLNRNVQASGAPIFLLAHHFRLSDAAERAVPYLLLAGHIARDNYANDQAVQHYRWALDILAGASGDPQVWEAREALGDVLCTLGRYDEAQREYALLLGRAGSDPAPAVDLPPAVAGEVLRSWGEALEKQGRYAEALDRLREAEAICRAHMDAVPPLLLAAIYVDMGQVLRRLGDFDAALDICRTGLSLIRTDRHSVEDERIEADLQTLMGSLFAMRGDYEQARYHFTSALAAHEAIDDLYGCARTHNNLGYLAQLQSDYGRAVRHYSEAESLASKVQSKYTLSSVLLNAAYAYFCLSRYEEALGACRDALALCQEMGDQLGVAQAADTLGMTVYQQGDYAAAAASYRKALAIYREQANLFQEGNTLALLARVTLAQGEPAAARALAEEALTIARRVHAPQHEAEALTVLAEIALSVGAEVVIGTSRAALLDEAQRCATAAAELAARLGSQLDYGVARRLQGEIAAARREPFAGHFLAALETLQAIDSAFERACVEARYSEALAALGDPAAAEYRKRAAETFRKIGAVGELRRLGLSDERSC
ncbi:MAG: adenylate/guanylate cyclase domain-containing protein [Oscillochloridaceae bacterium]|nr:tetratricopeptide repeat protein [Chloroflexaceae bacterium]MDW8390866.1 adenylate/guanylate cyclase domain-containing protein [Oscillochloridaceae bacterium]